MGPKASKSLAVSDSVRITNPDGVGRFVLTCDHASNVLPAEYGTLGLAENEISRHIAWDPGALAVARRLAEALDAPLVETRFSRLVLDCNRPLDAPDLIPQVSETTTIPGNDRLSAADRQARVALCWRPFHDAISALVEDRLAAGLETGLVSVHSFTPVYKGIKRPWHIGIVHDDDTRLSAPLIAALQSISGVVVGDNEPYSPADRVYFTLEKHARSRGLPCVMIELRNDEVADEAGQEKWAETLESIFLTLEPARLPKPAPFKAVHATEGTI